jgi:hypothetical protein
LGEEDWLGWNNPRISSTILEGGNERYRQLQATKNSTLDRVWQTLDRVWQRDNSSRDTRIWRCLGSFVRCRCIRSPPDEKWKALCLPTSQQNKRCSTSTQNKCYFTKITVVKFSFSSPIRKSCLESTPHGTFENNLLVRFSSYDQMDPRRCK